MKKSVPRIASLSFLLIASLAVLAGCSGNSQTSTSSPSKSAPVAMQEKDDSMMEKEQEKKMEDEKMMADEKKMDDIVAIAVGSKDHTTLVAALKAAGLVETLQGDGPFTVFAPVNAAFDALPAGTLDSLLKPENKDQLTGILTYHVVPAKAMSTDVVKLITDGGGSATVKTVAGGKLVLKSSGGNVTVTDESGNVATVTTVDLEASNGVIHIIDTVLLPHS